MNYKNLKEEDKQVYEIIEKEKIRRYNTLEMIPSENHTSPAVLEALSSILNDKYAEGYPKKRYYGGNEHIDEIEELCQKRARDLFGVPYVNVQGYSGSPANHAVYMATVNPGDKVMGMDLMSGGHLTHGWKVNFSGKYYDSVFYGVDEDTHLIDYEKVREIAQREKPKLILCGATAYPRVIDFKKFAEIADEVGAYLCADISHISGLVVSGAHLSPIPYVDVVTTTTHKTLRGPRGALIMVTDKGLKKDKKLGEKINKAVFPGLQGGPHEHTIAGIAVCLKKAAEPQFSDYGKQIVKNCKVLSEELIALGFNLVSGGTDNHLIVVDLRNKGISGSNAQSILEKSNIIVNKNTVPFDTASPFNPSGIRLGTPALTTRNMKEEEMKIVASLISLALEGEDVKNKVTSLCEKFPLWN